MAELTKKDIEKIVNSEIRKFIADSLDAELKKVLHSSNSQSRGEMIKTIKNAMEAVYRSLWQKHQYWTNEIK